ncbi:MAG: hypothetical protein M3162_02495 [Thermoproteota archaeon]|nr:hypothetical protein [Thermoproteota archaeon]
MLLSRKQKEEMVILLAEKGWTTRMIAREVHISLKDIGLILKRYTGEEIEPPADKMSTTSKAFKMFQEGKDHVTVAIALNIEADEVIHMYNDYLRLLGLDWLMVIYRKLDDKIHLFYHLFMLMDEAGLLSKSAIARFVQAGGRLTGLEEEWLKECDLIRKLKEKKVELENKIEELDDLLAFLRKTYSEAKKKRRNPEISN